MPDVISWPGDVATLDGVAARLRKGQLVGVAGDAGVDGLASALDLQAVSRLAALARPDVPLAICLTSANEIFDWVPGIRGAGVRLARDFWPGPMILISRLGLASGLLPKLPAGIRTSLETPEGLPLRLASDAELSALGAAAGVPLAIASLADGVRNGLDAILETQAGEPTAEITVAAADERVVRVLREGQIRAADLADSARARVVFVCTGNTCRSPMAEGLCRRLLADTLGIAEEELPARGFLIESAGMAAASGELASPEAVAVAQAHGVNLNAHRSRPLTMELVDRADHLFTMTAGHLRMLQSLHLPVGPEPQLLSVWGEDVPDPIGGPLELYQACAEQIRSSLRERLPQILEG